MIKTPIYTYRGEFPNYSIDEYGNIYNRNGKKLRWKINENGYANICLRKDNKSFYFKIHRLVMVNFGVTLDVFHPDINHKDGNKLNNHISNLEWVTRSENIKHAWDCDLRSPSPMYGIDNGNSKFTDNEIKAMLHGIFIYKLRTKEITEIFGCSESYVKALKRGIIRKALVENFKQTYLS